MEEGIPIVRERGSEAHPRAGVFPDKEGDVGGDQGGAAGDGGETGTVGQGIPSRKRAS